MMALVDCNSFFCSCERLFRPDLKNRPIGVLSNNDGCFVSVTPELKALGIKIGAPYFQYKDVCDKLNAKVFSSNFALYTNISNRVMYRLAKFSSRIQVYSVDEAFLDLTGIVREDDEVGLRAYGELIRKAIYDEIGIPVGVGIAPNKVLAKLANLMAKENKENKGVKVFMKGNKSDEDLKQFKVDRIWGIGGKSAEKCRGLGIRTAYDLKVYKNDKLIQKTFTKTGRMIQDELRGEKCFALDEDTENKQQIIRSRSFGRPVYEKDEIKGAIAHFISKACEKMRKEGSVGQGLTVYFWTSPYDKALFFSANEFIKLDRPTADTRKFLTAAMKLVDKLFRNGHAYKKAGITLSHFSNASELQLGLFEQTDGPKDIALMKVMDKINEREGELFIRSLACGGMKWKGRSDLNSPRYVNSWAQLPRAN